MLDGDNDDDNDWRRRRLWKSNIAMEHAFISLLLIINKKDFEQAYTVGH